MVCPYSLSRPGGVQQQAMSLTAELRRRGHDVRLVAPLDGPPPEPGIVGVGPSVEWESNGSVAPIATGQGVARRTIAALHAIEPDVVHLHEPLAPGPTLTALLGFEGPMVGTFHVAGDFPAEWLKAALPAVVGRLGVLCAVSEQAAALARDMYRHDCEVLWNGIDLAEFEGIDPWSAPRPAVLFLGRHEPRKGLRVLLDAWRGIDRDARLWIAGTGPETDALARGRLRDADWLGVLSEHDKVARLKGATVYCAPSLGGESFGIVLLEAMAARTAVVASSITGYANVARSDREALLVPPGDADALRAALRRVLDDDDLRRRLVAAGGERAEEFSMSRLAQRYEDVYQRARRAPVRTPGRLPARRGSGERAP
jgi:phosphatidylinositol alpha-mannosyltransferase